MIRRWNARLRQWLAVWHYGPLVAQACGVPVRRQLGRLLLLSLRSGTSPNDFYRYRMYRMPPTNETSAFISLQTHIRRRESLYRRLAIQKRPLTDKRVFYHRSATAGLPIPPTVAEFERGEVRWWSDRHLPRRDLFAKEAASLCGAGAARWDLKSEREWSGPAGRIVDDKGLLAELCRQSRSATMLLQHRLENHPDLVALGPVGLCTVRVVTLRAPDDPTPGPLLCVFRMPRGESVADNFARGGLACPVDLRTGELGRASYKNLAVAHLDVTSHPDTGAAITGRRLPGWDEVLALAVRAHGVFAEFPSVGWDIAITSGGPVLVEGNYNWDVVLAQQAGCRPLGATRFVDHDRAWHQRATAITG